jgi:hypothetical protein
MDSLLNLSVEFPYRQFVTRRECPLLDGAVRFRTILPLAATKARFMDYS